MGTTYRVCPQCGAQSLSEITTCDYCKTSLERLPEVPTSSGVRSHLIADAEKQVKISRNVLFLSGAVNLVMGLIGYGNSASTVFVIPIVGGAVYGILALMLRLETAVTVCTIAAVLLSLDLISSFVFGPPAGLALFTVPIVKGIFIAAMIRGRRAALMIS